MVSLPSAVIRFPRRNPLCLLVLLVPISLLLYVTFSPYDLWNPLRIISLKPQAPLDVSPPQSPVDDGVQTSPPPSPPSPTPPSNETSRILLVSCFFPLSKSKHTMNDYQSWLSKFLSQITTDIHFYTTPVMEDMVRQLRGDLPMILNTSFTSPFDIPPLQGREEAYTKMHAQDREKAYHNPELYAIWAAKPYLLAEALRTAQSSSASAKSYDYAFWTDAGAFRAKHAYRDWPGLDRVEEVWSQGKRESGQNADEMLFFPIQNLPEVSMLLWNDQQGPIDNDFSEGSFFGGKAKTIFWWENFYYTYHDYYLDQGVFVGKDQTLINGLFLLHPERIITVWHRDPAAPEAVYKPDLTPDSLSGPKFYEATQEILGDCGDPWYYYEFFLASWQEQEKMRAIWDSKWRFDFWKLSWWTRERKSCRVTRVLAMEWLLWRPFGEMWTPPKATLEDKLKISAS